jgi:ectoine hydroxylase-related dioxygenase (phytanoyl-CoA dioxygenase family)
MSVAALNLPDAKDLNVLEVEPHGELQSCNALLDDFPALQRFYEQNGYILLRQVLDPQSVIEARDAMLAIAVRHGLVRAGDPSGTWTGKTADKIHEESPEYRGISKRMFSNASNLAVVAKVLGESACMVPNVQYRLYPPNGPVTMVHQDGFYSPGVHDYKPVWVTLTPCQREVGGLMVAVGENRRGYFHNLARPSPFPVPDGVINPNSWATTDYMPGDVLLVNPYTPHGSRPNRSNRLRVTFDTRVQSARKPSAMAATVQAVTPTTVTVNVDDLGVRTYTVSADTFIRVLDPGVREPFESFVVTTKPGMRLLVVVDGDRAVMLRKAAEG